MTRNSSTDVCIQVPDVQAYKHNEIANAINCKFVNVSASMEPLDYSNLPAFLPAKDLPPCLYPWNVYSGLKKIVLLKQLDLMGFYLVLSKNLHMSYVSLSPTY